jgi:hypothetical protein
VGEIDHTFCQVTHVDALPVASVVDKQIFSKAFHAFFGLVFVEAKLQRPKTDFRVAASFRIIVGNRCASF